MRVSLILTHQCNMGCDYCFAGPKFNRKMPLDLGLRAMQMAFRGHPQEAVGLSFFGGEPMLEFASMVKISRAARGLARRLGRKLEFAVTTNATVLSKRQLDFLREYGFFVALSVDGWGEDHDRHRAFVNGRASSSVVWRNLERAAEARERARTAYRRLAEICFASMATDEPFCITPFADLHPTRPIRRSKCTFGVKNMAVSPRGNFYPCVRLVGTDSRPEVRIGSMADGTDRPRALELAAGCQEACPCIRLMPGPSLLDNHAFFHQLVEEVVCSQTA